VHQDASSHLQPRLSTSFARLSGWNDNCRIRQTQQLENDTPQVHARKSNIRKQTNDEEKCANCKRGNAGDDCDAAVVRGSSRVRASDQPSTANVAIKIDNFVFGPQAITVPVGTTVTWTNSDDIPHTAVSTDGVFKSKVIDTDEKFSYTFTKAGTYSYYCSVHPKMTGQVVVK
jgi:plastocyanin